MDLPKELWERKDDWTGITDPVERKKRQNRLHQRAWRRRKAGRLQETSETASWSSNNYVSHDDSVLGKDVYRKVASKCPGQSNPASYTRVLENWRPPPTITDHGNAVFSQSKDQQQGKTRSMLISPILPYLTTRFSHFTIPPFNFPLSPDHQLLPLIQYNVLRAVMTNMCLLSLAHRMPLECEAAFAITLLPVTAETIPPCLLPTKTQLSVPHDTWIDTFPVPAMRDNLILYRDKIDADDLCCDVIGGLYEGYNDLEKRGMLVWSDPWHPDGWEVTEGFANKWGFLLKGCDELLWSTNRWRSLRGEERLMFEV